MVCRHSFLGLPCGFTDREAHSHAGALAGFALDFQLPPVGQKLPFMPFHVDVAAWVLMALASRAVAMDPIVVRYSFMFRCSS